MAVDPTTLAALLGASSDPTFYNDPTKPRKGGGFKLSKGPSDLTTQKSYLAELNSLQNMLGVPLVQGADYQSQDQTPQYVPKPSYTRAQWQGDTSPTGALVNIALDDIDHGASPRATLSKLQQLQQQDSSSFKDVDLKALQNAVMDYGKDVQDQQYSAAQFDAKYGQGASQGQATDKVPSSFKGMVGTDIYGTVGADTYLPSTDELYQQEQQAGALPNVANYQRLGGNGQPSMQPMQQPQQGNSGWQGGSMQSLPQYNGGMYTGMSSAPQLPGGGGGATGNAAFDARSSAPSRSAWDNGAGANYAAAPPAYSRSVAPVQQNSDDWRTSTEMYNGYRNMLHNVQVPNPAARQLQSRMATLVQLLQGLGG